MDLAWLTLLALLVVIAASCTTRVNPGVAAVGLAWLIARFAAPRFGQTLGEKALWAGFPAELFLTLVGVSLLFAQAEANGTLHQVARGAERLCRGRPGLVPVLFFLLALGLGSVGPGNIAVAGLVAPIALAAARRSGISPLLMALLVGHGAIGSSVSPFTAAGVVANQKLAEIGITGAAWQVYGWNAAANALAAAAGYVLFGGWRLWRAGDKPQAPHDPTALEAALAPQHGLTLAVIGLMIAAVVVARIHVGMAALVGAALLALAGAADEGAALRRIPWSVLLMVCGVSVLTALLDKTGGSQRLAGLIGAAAGPRSLPAMVALVTGVVSIYGSTTGVVLPAFLPLVKDLAASQAGSNALRLALAVVVGGNLVDMSPLSTIGALCLAAAPAECDRRLLFNQLLAWGFAMAAAGAVLAWVWF
jgi:di/tricarboxylate transporter